ncbi:MAG: calcium-translocating P-type ATPase, PMCA-type [Deltaproteobacteria bacterium]|nr:MAG: calcium-translocating P-type ATPase, PMCA-type [Deltaproteobacteria bacterium]
MTEPQSIDKKTHYQGLTDDEVIKSREEHGSNLPTPPTRKPWWKLYLEKYDDPVIRILLIAAVLAIGLGWVDGSFLEGIGIVVAVLLATTLAFFNEYRANQEFDVLNQINEEVAVQVIRNGTHGTVPRKDLVVGDIVLVEQGEEIPADGTVLEAVSFLVDESRLTGESVPVNKRPSNQEDADSDEDTTYAVNHVLRGTLASDGHAVLELTAVGDHTEMGQTAKAATEETTEDSPLNLQLERLSKLLGVIGFLVAFLIFAALTLRGVLTEELQLTRGQWGLMGAIGIGALLALVRIWLPIVYDAKELMGLGKQRPGWLERSGITAWLVPFTLGLLVAGGIVGTLVGLGWVQGSPTTWLPIKAVRPFLHFFMVSVTIIVVTIPEGLAMSVTLSLAYSMRKMTQMNNLVRKMVACETIGSATVICSDKTGTLTQNKMHVEEARFGLPIEEDVEPTQEPTPLVAEAMAANSTANLSHEEGQEPETLGNPTESALLLWLDAHDNDYQQLRDDFTIVHQFTFSTERKYMATLGSSQEGANILHVKGAPEIVLERCSSILVDDEERALQDKDRETLQSQILSYAKRGMRTLGFAYKTEVQDPNSDDPETIAQEMVWLGFVALVDPIRPDAAEAVQACLDAGIQVKIVTGDNAETAKEVARSIGLLEDEQDHVHLTGPEFEALSDEEAAKAVLPLVVLSRARPLHKLRLVKLLQQQQHVVAVTGDGSNDAPALHHAQVGLAMGNGTAVAKEASDIILLDNSFQSIKNAVLWGRSLYLNIQKFLLFQLTINVTALSIALLGPFLNIQLPLTVIQMLWVNLIMDTFAALALATEPPHSAVMDQKPRSPEAFIITPTMARNIFLTGAVFVVALLGLLIYLKQGGLSPYELSFFFTAFVLAQFWNMFNARALGTGHSALYKLKENPGFLAIAVAILVGQFLIVHFGGSIFRTVPLSLRDWGIIIGITSLIFVVGEAIRWFQKSRNKHT